MTDSRVVDIRQAPVPAQLQAPVLLPPCETVLEYKKHYVGNQFGRGVLTVWFVAVEYGGVAIPRYYNVNARRRGFIPAPGSDLVRDFRRVFTRRLPRLDRFPLHWLENTQILGELRTVTTNHRQEPIGDGAEYSVVGRLLKLHAQGS